MALRYHPASGNQGRRLLLGGSATTQQPQPPPPWHSRQAARYYDSDDDSGIGHSNGGQTDRVGSTSSTETEVPQDFSNTQLSPGNLQKWWSGTGPQPNGQRQIAALLPVDPWLSQQRVPLTTIPLSLTSGFCPPAVSTPEGSECADDVFHPHKGPVLNRRPKVPNVKPTLQREQYGAGAFQATNRAAFHDNVQKTPKGTLQKCKSFNHNSGLSQGEKRRVWSYCGDGNYYPNVYENVRHGGNMPMVSQDAPTVPQDERTRSRANWCKPTRAISWRDNEFGYLNREALANHYDIPVSLTARAMRETSRLQGAKSASLSSLITENDLVRVHAFPASVIPASEIGDTLSDSFYVQHGALELNSRYVPQPPPPPPPPVGGALRMPSGLPRPRPQNIPNGVREPTRCYVGPPPVHAVHQPGRENGFKDSNIKDMPTPKCTTGEVAYATVIKPKHKMNAGQKASPSSPASAFLDEIEPPLPPRNYRRDLASSKHLATSKTSLTDKMQGFSRTAKQALRQAFSMEGLNCASESAHNDSDEWDNESDWGRIINPKPRTPAAVKARDANRQKLKRSNSAKHPTTMATLC